MRVYVSSTVLREQGEYIKMAMERLFDESNDGKLCAPAIFLVPHGIKKLGINPTTSEPCWEEAHGIQMCYMEELI